MEHLSRVAAQDLPPLPSQSSRIREGRYVIKHTQEKEVEAKNDQVKAEIWFKSPV